MKTAGTGRAAAATAGRGRADPSTANSAGGSRVPVEVNGRRPLQLRFPAFAQVDSCVGHGGDEGGAEHARVCQPDQDVLKRVQNSLRPSLQAIV